MIFETFAQRKRLQSRGGEPEIYTYDHAPKHMRVQICMALSEGIGEFFRMSYASNPTANRWWEEVDRICSKEIPSYLDYVKCCETRNLKERFVGYVACRFRNLDSSVPMM
jgi:hypothetical protein